MYDFDDALQWDTGEGGLYRRWAPKARKGTAGALRGVPDLTGSFLVMNGGVLTTLDRALMDTHVADGALLTVATKAKPVEVNLG